MGGRVAEELSKPLEFCGATKHVTSFSLVYGSENVTSGASSDIRNATRTAQAMVKVSNT